MSIGAVPVAERLSSGLEREHFRCIGNSGVTSPFNSYSHSMCWFKGRLYIGTFRNSLCLINRKDRTIPPAKMDFWPVYCPVPEDPASLRAEIIAYDPLTGQWELLHQSVMVEEKGRLMPRDLGYRGMGVYQGQSDPSPCLYTGNISRHGCYLLRSEDGSTFADAGPMLDGISVRTLLPFRDKFYTSIIGKKGHYGNESFQATVIETDDPTVGRWVEVSPNGLGDPTNTSIFDMEAFQDHLYVSTMNHVGGFQVWKSDLSGRPPHRWKRVLPAGGYRGFLNEFGLKLTSFGDCLYVGTGIAGGGYDRVHNRGPAAAEILRIWPDDSWDLVVGSPRLTPDGMKYPTSGMGPGFDNFLNGYMWFMEAHEGWLYIGTFNGAAFFPFKPHSLQSPASLQALRDYVRTTPADSIEEFLHHYGGCGLWRTRDGERFYPITRNGFENPFNMGIRRMVSTPHGLFVGTSNPFGPFVGVQDGGKWSYKENPRGGIEVWIGSRESAASEVAAERGRDQAQQRRHAPLKVQSQLRVHSRRELSLAITGQGKFQHLGYWPAGTQSPEMACRKMVDAVLALGGAIDGPVLDVGCLHGATTRLLGERLGAGQVTGIDELQACVDRALLLNPQQRFCPMDPTQLEFADATFGAVVCFEQAATFDTRAAFLKEALRVLRPGGQLLLADVLWSRPAIVARRGLHRANYLTGPAAYQRLVERTGFDRSPQVQDVAPGVIAGYSAHLSRVLRRRFAAREMTERDFNRAMGSIAESLLTLAHYLLLRAVKPQ